MKTIVICYVVIILCIFSLPERVQPQNYTPGVTTMVESIHWLGHDCFKITSNAVIYTDPYNIKKRDVADIILITHEHFDHCSPDDIQKVCNKNTVIIAPPDCVAKIKHNVQPIKPYETLTFKGITIQAVPAYNTNKQFHPKSKQWVGYIITIDTIRIYFAGDTDLIPEMKTFKNIDIALLPVSGTYVMNVDEAVQATRVIKPKVVIPMHYGSIVGTIVDAKKFKEILNNEVAVIIKDIE